MTRRLVIFDWDGTLSDSLEGIVISMGAAFAGHGLAPPEETAVRAIVGRSLHHGIAELAGEAGAHLVDGLAAAYLDHFATRHASAPDRLFAGAGELVRDLAALDHVSLAIATGKERAGLDRVLGPTGIGHLFDDIQTSDIAASKPDPEMVINAMLTAGTEPHETVMVGDSVLDVAMARAAGVHALAVTWGAHGRDGLAQAGADALVDDIDALRAALARFVGNPGGEHGHD